MTERYPHICLERVVDGVRSPCVQTSLSICFYMRRAHPEVAPGVLRALDVYRKAISPHALAWYPDTEGDWRELDAAGWALNHRKLLQPKGATLWLRATPDLTTDYEFRYYGREGTCAAAFWFPTGYLETQGPERVRELAIALGAELPFNSGHTGLSFYCHESLLGVTDLLRNLSFRYPGMDMPNLESLPMDLSTRVKGAYWLTFLGAPVLDSLGGVTALRSRLHSSSTQVEELSAGGAMVRLGEWPEAGDLEHGHTLPAYRELARVLEPWLYRAPHSPWSGFSDEDAHRWERRFLE